jgi:carotenoid cleavage dioxygenase
MGNFAPIAVETTAFDLPVRGQIPEELEGRLLRIGPNPVEADPATYHWFTGEGMAHGLRLRGGKAEWYRNRWIVSDGFAADRGREPLPGPRNGAPDVHPNTNIVAMGGRTYALVEAGALPVELTDELESMAWSNLGGTLRHGFSAHPKADPVTGQLHVITYQPGLEAVSYLVVDARGRARTVADIPAPHCPMVHDVAFTQRYAIFLDLPVDFDLGLVGKGLPFAWTDARAPRIGLIPRDGNLTRARWIEAPADRYVFHVMNAFDDGEAVVMDVVVHGRVFDRTRGAGDKRGAVLERWRLEPATGRLSRTLLFDQSCEFPRFNDARGGLPYRFGYTAGAERNLGPLQKHHVSTGRTLVHDFGPGRSALEPVFVARSNPAAEDDGYVMAYVYDQGRDASEVVILDAQAFDAEPVAIVELPVRVPFGFHGNWVADGR